MRFVSARRASGIPNAVAVFLRAMYAHPRLPTHPRFFSGNFRGMEAQSHSLFKILQCRNHHLGFPSVGTVHGLTVVAKSFLGEAFRVSASAGTLGPSVAVAVERHALNHQATAGSGKLGCPMRLAHLAEFGKERADFRE